jgi:hypothetical protein
MPAPAVSVTAFLAPQAVPFAKVCGDGLAVPGHALTIDGAGVDGSGWQCGRPL